MKAIIFLSILCVATLNGAYCQGVNEGKLLDKLIGLHEQKDSVETAYNFLKTKSIKRRLSKLDRKISKIESNNQVKDEKNNIFNSYAKGLAAYNNMKFDSAVIYLSPIITKHGKILFKDSVNFLDIYIMLTEANIQIGSIDSALYFFDLSLKEGNDDFLQLVRIFDSDLIENRNYLPYLNVLTKNAILNCKSTDVYLEFTLSTILFRDQYPRLLCYAGRKKMFEIEDVYLFDTINQLIFKQLFTSNVFNHNIQNDVLLSKAFAVTLLHSIYSNVEFFETYFYLLVDRLGGDFVANQNLRTLIDFYLKAKYNTQYFETTRGFREDGSFGILPKENNDTIKSVLKRLNIKTYNIGDY